jgi:hypothetical protein
MPPFLIPMLINFGISKAMGASTKNALMNAAIGAVLPGAGGTSALQGGAGGGLGALFSSGATPTIGQIAAQGLPQFFASRGGGNPLMYAAGQGIGGYLGQGNVLGSQQTMVPANQAGITDPSQLKAAMTLSSNASSPMSSVTDFIKKNPGASAAVGAGLLPFVSDMFGDDKEKKYLPIPNQGYSKLTKAGFAGTPTGFQIIDPSTGSTRTLEDKDTYQTVEEILGPEPTQTYKAVEMNQGGIVSVAKFNEGGLGQILPSKFTHDEDDANNYQRASGFVMDGTGNGKDHEDTMLAQLADGEFVSRSHAVLGAGILSGASPADKKEQRKLGAKYFYEQQARFKRIFDLINANKDRTDSVH